MKTKKMFGIGAVVLMILVAVIPAINGTQLNTENEKNSLAMVDWDEIRIVLESHKDDVEEINQYVNDYIAKHGYIDLDFALPNELQVKFNNILEETGIEPLRPGALEQIKEQPRGFKIISTLMQRMNKYPSFLKLYDIINKWIFNKNSMGGGYALTFETTPGGCTCEIFGVGTKTSTNENGGEWGHCTFYDLEEGEYDWEVSKSGYISESGSIYLDCSGKIIVVLEEGVDDSITKIAFNILYIWIIWQVPIGFKAELWMSHSYIENNLEPAFAFGALGIALLIIALGTVTMGIAWLFGAFLLSVGIEGIDNCDQGRGVYILFALGVITVFPPRMEPQ